MKSKSGVPSVFAGKTISDCSINSFVHLLSKAYFTLSFLMTVAMKKYKDVYLISPCATSEYHETTADGTHFGDYGYTLWAESIIEPVMKILKKYGIK